MQFCWIPSEEYYNFCYTLFLDIFSMKNRNVKKLDLRYLKFHESLVSNFRICCVLCYD
jgi:hypothetical protein